MVIVPLRGGLGNQLFQYATGRAIAYRNNVPLKLNIQKYEDNPFRKYELDSFNIVASIASPDDIARLTRSGQRGLGARGFALIQRCLPYYRRSVVTERYHHFDPNILKVSGKVYLVGYWQSEKYFADIKSLLRKELAVRYPPDRLNQETSQLIGKTESVSVHVRRGDYVSNPAFHQHHGVCSLGYYRVAVQELTHTVKEPHFFVFSDDMEWVRENLRLSYPISYVAHNGIEKAYEDLRLMSQCKHHIIANSTFSWWGAWLCTHPAKIVVAPKKWFNKADRDDRDLIPALWIRV